MDNRYALQSDELLIETIRSGKTDAVSELVARYLPLIRHKASAYRLPGMESDDVVQEGLVGLVKAIASYQPSRSGFGTFASICISGSLATAAKQALSQKGLPLRDYTTLSDGALSAPADLSTDPEQCFVAAEGAAELKRRIETRLSTLERQTLKLYLSGHSYTEISNSLATTTKAVDNALQRVRRKLRTA